MDANYSIGEFSKKTNVSVRTLHYYDEINILKPSFVSESGRRYYSDSDLIELQKILSLKYLGLSLDEIKKLIQTQEWNLKETLTYQKLELIKRKQHFEKIIKTLDHALHLIDNNLEVEPTIFMSLITNMQFEDEQKEWLKTILNEEKVTQLYEISDDKQKEFEKKFYQISVRLKNLYGTGIASDHLKVQEVIKNYIQLTEETAMTPIQSLLEDLPDEIDEDPWLFPSPFTKAEEEWVATALEYYLKDIGVELNEK